MEELVMWMSRLGLGGMLVLAAALLTGACAPAAPSVDYRRELPAGTLALVKIAPDQYPDFHVDPASLPNVRASVRNSLAYLNRPSSRNAAFYPYLDISHDRAVATLTALDDLIGQELNPGPPDVNRLAARIVERFDVYKSIGGPLSDNSGNSGKVLFTGYYTPICDASPTRTGDYIYPLYKRPADLIRDENTGVVSGRKLADGKIVPYYTRREIESGNVLAGDELVWLKSRWLAYVVTVQGSAELRMPDGTLTSIGFSGDNGYDYTSPRARMLADGVISADQYTLSGLGKYFQEHPQDIDKYLSANDRYVFFTYRSGGPFGSLNVPVTAMATIATDKPAISHDIYPRAMPAFLDVAIPSASGGFTPFRGFMMDQDTGGGIRASGRCDIYMGTGEQAEQIAGRQLQEGALYYIAIKPQFMAAPPSP
jgi:membrane-bound lytic murein transglycosylase A